MCVVSMVMDHYRDEWGRRVTQPPAVVPFWQQSHPLVPPVSQQEIEEFRRLLERAREYDQKNREPDCELESKKQQVRDLAEQLGIKVDFL